jgi:nucleoid-associated protein YgaU
VVASGVDKGYVYAERPAPGGRAAQLRAHRARARRRRERRLRGLVRLVLLIAIIAAVVWAGARVANATADRAAVSERIYVVRAGDTLWQIAADAYGSGRDLRPLVYGIERRNGLSSADLAPGQRLVLPAVIPE